MEKVVLIPAYQPASRLIEFSNQLINQGFRVLVIDDGSGCKYNKIFERLNSEVMKIRYAINQGKGHAIKVGLRYLKEHISKEFLIITADADGQHSVFDIKVLSNRYNDYAHCLMLGVRDFNGQNVPLKSRFGNVITRKIFAVVTKKVVSDTQTGLRCFDDSLIDFMLSVSGNRFEYETNVLLESTREGVEIIEEPIITIYENNNQGSHFNAVTDSFAIYKEIIKFASSSIVCFIIDYFLYMLLLSTTASWTLATSITFSNIIARMISASINFTINRKFIFNKKDSVFKSAAGYFVLAILILIGNTALLNVLIEKLSINPYISKLITELAFFAVSYFVQRNIIFKKKRIATKEVSHEKNNYNN